MAAAGMSSAFASASGLASSPVQITALMNILPAWGLSFELEKRKSKNIAGCSLNFSGLNISKKAKNEAYGSTQGLHYF